MAGFGYRSFSVLFSQLTAEFVDEAHARGMSVVSWTVDAKKDVRNMIGLSIDAIITNDAPSVVAELDRLRKDGSGRRDSSENTLLLVLLSVALLAVVALLIVVAVLSARDWYLRRKQLRESYARV